MNPEVFFFRLFGAAVLLLIAELALYFVCRRSERLVKKIQKSSSDRTMELLARNREFQPPYRMDCRYCEKNLTGDPKAEMVRYGCCPNCARDSVRLVQLKLNR